MRTTKIKVEKGALLINRAFLYKKYKDIALVIVDMKSKRGEILITGNSDGFPDMYISATEDSLYLNTKCKKDKPTLITFLGFKNWNIITTGISKYSVFVCLVKD